jgi:ParB family chromosome partitioning protein
MAIREAKHSGLGRGLASLIPQRSAAGTAGVLELPIERIKRNPFQPRQNVDEQALADLTESVRQHGVIQPILVTEQLDGYQLVAGERRLRAAQAAGLQRIPAVVRQLAARDQLELALVENLQRQDLNPIEEAAAFRQLIDEFGFTQEQLAARFGRARSTVANTLRLLEMREGVRVAVAEGRLTEGHARALAGLGETQEQGLIQLIADRDLSVRQTEELARRLRDQETPATGSTSAPSARIAPDPDLQRVEEELRTALGTKVSLARSRKGGRIVIEYYSDEDLSRLYDRLVGVPA